jgi:hypothetical protein
MNVGISRRRGITWRALALGGVVVFGGCESAAVKPGGTVPLVVSSGEKTESVSVPLTHLLVLTLPPTPAGHSWQIAYHDMRYLKQQIDARPARRAGEGPSFAFLAQGLGTTRLHFLLLPDAGAGGLDPVDQREIRVRIQ